MSGETEEIPIIEFNCIQIVGTARIHGKHYMNTIDAKLLAAMVDIKTWRDHNFKKPYKPYKP